VAVSDWSGVYEPTVSHVTATAPGYDGAIYDGSYLDAREITINVGYVAGFDVSDIQSWRRTLLSVVNPKLTSRNNPGRLTLVEDGVSRLFYAIPDSPDMASISRRNGANEVVVTFQCFDPFAYDGNTTIRSASEVIPDVEFPLELTNSFIFGTQQTGGVTIISNGDVETPVLITIYGPCTNPILENTTTGEAIEINKVIDTLDVLVIDTRASTVYINGANSIQYVTVDSVFWKLQPGSNVVAFSEDVGATQAICTVEYNDCFIGF
jgi:phage-related protein